MTFGREQKIVAEFRSDDETAALIRDTVFVAAMALIDPTTDNASKLFKLGCLAVATAAQRDKARELLEEA